jgi:hypothetical protein
VAVFERINRAGNQWSQEKRLGIFNELLRDAQEGFDNPLSFTSEDIEMAATAADQIIDQMLRFDELNISYEFAVEKIKFIWPHAWSVGPEASQLNFEIDFFDNLSNSMRSNVEIDISEVTRCLDELDKCMSRISELLSRAEDENYSAEDDSRRFDSGHDMGIRDKALSLFGFLVGSSPSKDEINYRWRAYVKSVGDPGDQTLSAEERVRRTAAMQEANCARDLLFGI